MASTDAVGDKEYQEGLDALSSLISGRVRADGKNWSHAFDMMKVYLERLELEEELAKLSVVHVAGTKGKGSTCAMVESILRHAGYTTGLYTSPHLVDVRERIRMNGVPIDRATFLRHLWACYNTLRDKADEDAGKPAYFRFLTLMGFKAFLEAGVDVAILEVGLGGRLDATNCVREPVVCGIAALGFDHMDLLGHTLPEIAREKAGIFKAGRPALSVPQRADAAAALDEVAERVGAPLATVRPLDEYTCGAAGVAAGQREAGGSAAGMALGLAGEHQRQNAALAVALAAEWEARSPVAAAKQGQRATLRAQSVRSGVLPPEYMAGLQAARWPGRGQVIHDFAASGSNGAHLGDDLAASGGTNESPESGAGVGIGPPREAAAGSAAANDASKQSAASRLTFYLDGAHTAESMVTCGSWFADAVAAAPPAPGLATQRVLLFNCMPERDPLSLLQPLAQTLAERGAPPHHAIFVPPDSVYSKLGPADGPPDLAWQLTLRGVWERLGGPQPSAAAAVAAGRAPPGHPAPKLLALPAVAAVGAQDALRGAVLPSLSVTVEWLRRCVREAPALRVQVLVTGSLYLVGDLLRLLGSGRGAT